MNCGKCKTKAVISLPRHNAAFCKGCFTTFVHEQVARAIKSFKMFTPEYSEESHRKVRRYADTVAAAHGAKLIVHVVEQEAGAGIRELATVLHRPTCSTCGTIKRYQFNRAAVEQDYDVMATGHNLDDEAARLLGNVLHWQEEYLDKQSPTLPASVEGFAKKVKPLCRLSEREIAAYAVVNRIDYIVEECPMAKGSKMILYKEVLNRLRRISERSTPARLAANRPLRKSVPTAR